jgi:cytochrome c oxidase assembly protein subunit 15
MRARRQPPGLRATDPSAHPMPSPPAEPDPRLVRRLARAAAVLMVATLMLSAFMRLSQAGLAAATGRPATGQAARQMLAGAAAPSGDAGHRAGAAGAPGDGVRGPAAGDLAGHADLGAATLAGLPQRRPCWLACTLALVAAGRVHARRPCGSVVAMGNLLGGFVLLALCVRLAAPPLPDLRIRRAARLAAALLLLQAAAGVMVSASGAALACLDWAGCLQGGADGGWDWRALDPLRRPELLDAPPFNPAGALVQLVHRSLALPTLLGVLWLAYACRRGGQSGEALAVVVLLGVQLLLAVSLHPAGLPMALVLAHNAAAAALLALALRRV